MVFTWRVEHFTCGFGPWNLGFLKTSMVLSLTTSCHLNSTREDQWFYCLDSYFHWQNRIKFILGRTYLGVFKMGFYVLGGESN